MNKFIFLLLLSFVLLPLYGSAVASLVGGWSPISDVKDPHVVEIGQFAVTEFNKQSKTRLEFKAVVSGETQVVAGTNYRLILAANEDGEEAKNYMAIVWEKPWLNYRNLTSFKPANINGRFS